MEESIKVVHNLLQKANEAATANDAVLYARSASMAADALSTLAYAIKELEKSEDF